MFNSDAKQDEFVANMTNFKSNGAYLDIGSHNSIKSNNSYYFDELNWTGICVEIDSQHNDSYKTRKNCNYYNNDANSIDYKNVLDSLNFPKVIDYLSLDVDTLSLSVLLKLPFDDYEFSIITIEHDFYVYGDYYRSHQRDFLKSKGYFLICSDVYVQQDGFDRELCSFEDWWVKPEYFNQEVIDKVKSEMSYPSQIIDKFNIKI